MWIVLWDPFLMKKLIKNEICGSMNSARTHWLTEKSKKQGQTVLYYCACPLKVWNACRKEKKKKKGKTQNAKVNVDPNLHLMQYSDSTTVQHFNATGYKPPLPLCHNSTSQHPALPNTLPCTPLSSHKASMHLSRGPNTCEINSRNIQGSTLKMADSENQNTWSKSTHTYSR